LAQGEGVDAGEGDGVGGSGFGFGVAVFVAVAAAKGGGEGKGQEEGVGGTHFCSVRATRKQKVRDRGVIVHFTLYVVVYTRWRSRTPVHLFWRRM